MSPRKLLEKLESLGTIDPKILQKIRQEIDNPDKKVKPKAILNYLVKKQQLTESQAVRLLKSDPSKPAEDEPAPTAPPPKDYDTSELMGLAPESENVEPTPAPPSKMQTVSDIDATLMDEGQFTDDEDEVVEVQPIQVPSKIEEIAPIESAKAEEFEEVAELKEFGDTFDRPYAEARAPKTNVGFEGKVNLKDQWATKWLYIGFGILGFLIIMGAVLFVATMGVKAEDQFEAAVESFKNNAFQDAVAKFDEYIEDNPSHKYVPRAKARRIQCILAGAYTSKNWSETINSANTLLPPLLEDEDTQIDIIRDDLAVMLPRSLFEITENAKKINDLNGMQEVLGTITGYKKIVDNAAFIPSSQRRKPTIASNLSKIDNNLRTIEGKINKEKRVPCFNRNYSTIGQ